ncbi:MAG TPA: LysE family translocator [Paracoccus sp. (in: a-proteobacteria)]|uniref:LysE family translocator n=1 Tax=uncultured Paracoccus sp. TaxID=189685 RepID=UPI0026144610|nr:LysE family translocator [uncultured Paracoccus sp.]HMQ42087.1 LysE family translocator [Paracoccus sp. (in: a-proteobacteria)]HMR35820.1 LysE family translocator [Paracoccus sp. (in: a-proteobacteria)]
MRPISTRSRDARTADLSGLEPYLALIGLITIALLSPGPAIVAAIQTSFSRGREVALPFGLGLAVGASLWCLFALAGLALLFKTYPPLYYSVKILGGFYIIWVAWGMWRAATSPLPEAAEKRFGRGFLGGVLLNLSNPKPALFYAALILRLFPGPLTLAGNASIYATALSTELFWYATVTISMSTATMRRHYFGAKFWIDRTAAIALFALGILLIFKS